MANEDQDVNGLDVIDIIRILNRKSRAYQRLMLTDIEQVITDEELFKRVKKICLDQFNDYVRSVSRALVGEDVEK